MIEMITRPVSQDSADDVVLVFDQREKMMATIREIMTVDLITVAPSITVMRAASAMLAGKAGSVLVIDGSDLVGIFTERDILKALVHHSDAGRASPVRNWMTRDPLTVSPEARAEEALDLMLTCGFRHLPVKEGDRLVGIVSMRDLSRILTGS
jgi:CBS domain-containing protein